MLKCKFYLSINWAKSLKDKRQCVKSLVERLKSKFNISIAEIGELESYTLSEIGFAVVSNSKAHAERMGDTVLNFAETVTDAEIYGIETELI